MSCNSTYCSEIQHFIFDLNEIVFHKLLTFRGLSYLVVSGMVLTSIWEKNLWYKQKLDIMKTTIKTILGTAAITALMGTSAFAQDTEKKVDVKKEVETEQGEAEYSYESKTDDGETETKADYYSETDTDARESETEIEHKSETDANATQGLTQEDLDKKADKATTGQDDMAQDTENSAYLGSVDQNQEKSEIEPERLPNAVTDSITNSEYATWTITRVYEIAPEDNKNQQSISGETEQEAEVESEYGYASETETDVNAELESESEFSTESEYATESQSTSDESVDAVVYEIHFLNPDGNQVESKRYDEQGVAR